jgi:ketosteroid isomerase-like protein
MDARKLEQLARGHAYFNAGEFDRFGEIAREDLEWGTTGSFPGIEPMYRGPAGIAEWARAVSSAWENFTVRLVEVFDDSGDRLVVHEVLRGRGLESGVEVEMPIFTIYSYDGERLRARHAYTSKAELFEAAGLKEPGT